MSIEAIRQVTETEQANKQSRTSGEIDKKTGKKKKTEALSPVRFIVA